MQHSLLDFIVCPSCQSELRLEVFLQEASEVLEGALLCSGCGSTYPIKGGVPKLLVSGIQTTALETAQAFGWQWKRFTNLLLWEQQREQFLDWLAPLTPEHFHGHIVLDAGCGMGRLTEVAASFGPEALIGVDLSGAVEVAWHRLRGRSNVHLMQADVFNLPFRQGKDGPFDLAYATGVLHHLDEPREGFHKLAEHLKPGGRIHGWLYGKEGNAWIEHLVDPVRRGVTSRLPRQVLSMLSTAMSVPLHTVARSISTTPALQSMPYSSYLKWLGRYNFRHTTQVVFDHLGPPVSYYFSREELEAWFDETLRLLDISHRNQNSWRILGEKVA